MRQALVIARHDLRRQWREGGLVIVVLLFTALLLAAALHGAGRARDARETAAQLANRTGQSAAEVAQLVVTGAPDDAIGLPWDARNPDFLANDRGTLAIATPAPLLSLSVGQTSLYPTQVKVTASGRNAATTAAEIANPLALATGTFDVEFVIVFLWPLALLAATFDLAASDRERGTLRMLLAQPVAAESFLGGTLVARVGPILAPALAVPWLLMQSADASSLWYLALWSAVVIAYGVFWLGLAAWVASRGGSAVAGAVRLGGAWLIVTMVIPGAVGLVMTTWGRVPSGVVFADATRSATRDALLDGSRVLGHFLEDHPTPSAVGRDGLRQYALLQAARDREVERRLAPVVESYEAALEKQRQIAAVAQLLSPAMVVSNALQQAAGTSRDRALDFAGQVDVFREQWRAYFQPRILEGAPLTRLDAAALPRFEYREPSWTAAAARLLPGVAVVLAIGVALLMSGLRRWARSPLERALR